MNVLVIEKRSTRKAMFQSSLLLRKHNCTHVESHDGALKKLRSQHDTYGFDAIIVNQFFHKENSLSLITALRKESLLPIFMITHHEESSHGAMVLDAGADEHMSYPFSMDEFSARLNRLICRQPYSLFVSTAITLGDLTIDLKRHAVYTSKSLIALTKTEYKILVYLVMHRRAIISRDDLHDAVLPHGKSNEYSHSMNMHMFNLRKKVGKYVAIQTVPCRGYVMI